MLTVKEPVLGDRVFYKDGEVYAALVIKLEKGMRVNLQVWDGDGRSFVFKNVDYAETPTDRCWSWVMK
jgi:hypothetical protein